jgi:hypothetical protein
MPFTTDGRYDDAVRADLRRAWDEAMEEEMKTARATRKQKQLQRKKEAKAEEDRLLAEAIRKSNEERATLVPKEGPKPKRTIKSKVLKPEPQKVEQQPTLKLSKPKAPSTLGACIEQAMCAAKTSAADNMLDYVNAVVARVSLGPDKCSFCSKKTSRKKVFHCRCGHVEYCSLMCQKLHWECHSVLCIRRFGCMLP